MLTIGTTNQISTFLSCSIILIPLLTTTYVSTFCPQPHIYVRLTLCEVTLLISSSSCLILFLKILLGQLDLVLDFVENIVSWFWCWKYCQYLLVVFFSFCFSKNCEVGGLTIIQKRTQLNFGYKLGRKVEKFRSCAIVW